METYTLTWHDSCGLTDDNYIRRCRFDRASLYWTYANLDALESFAWLLTLCPILDVARRFESPDFCLFRCGKLIARAATYQGV